MSTQMPSVATLLMLGMAWQATKETTQPSHVLEVTRWNKSWGGGYVITVRNVAQNAIVMICPINDEFTSERKRRALMALESQCTITGIDPCADKANMDKWRYLLKLARMQ